MMRKHAARSVAAVVTALFLTAVGLLPAGPAAAATTCFGTGCDNAVVQQMTGCSFVSVGGASHGEVITIRYSKGCHAAYVELDWPTDPGSNTPQVGAYFYQPQYGGPEHIIDFDAISPTVEYSRLVSWDYSIKGCFNYNVIGQEVVDPDVGSPPNDFDFCSPWY